MPRLDQNSTVRILLVSELDVEPAYRRSSKGLYRPALLGDSEPPGGLVSIFGLSSGLAQRRLFGHVPWFSTSFGPVSCK